MRSISSQHADYANWRPASQRFPGPGQGGGARPCRGAQQMQKRGADMTRAMQPMEAAQSTSFTTTLLSGPMSDTLIFTLSASA